VRLVSKKQDSIGKVVYCYCRGGRQGCESSGYNLFDGNKLVPYLCSDSAAYFRDKSNEIWPLDDQQMRALTNPKVTRDVDLSESFLEQLVVVDCFSKAQRAAVWNTMEEKRPERFLNILKRRSLADYIEFVRCLKSTKQDDVYDILKDTGGNL
jgi:hypothetical protein